MKTLVTFLTLFIATGLFAQPPGGPGNKEERKERIKAHKIAFISTELDLTTEEAEKFWPIYNEMEAELDEINEDKRATLKKMRDFEELSDDESYELTEKLFDYEAKENAIRKKYLSKFASVVGKKKAAKVFVAEERFKRELLKQIKQGPHGGPREGGPGGPGGPCPPQN